MTGPGRPPGSAGGQGDSPRLARCRLPAAARRPAPGAWRRSPTTDLVATRSPTQMCWSSLATGENVASKMQADDCIQDARDVCEFIRIRPRIRRYHPSLPSRSRSDFSVHWCWEWTGPREGPHPKDKVRLDGISRKPMRAGIAKGSARSATQDQPVPIGKVIAVRGVGGGGGGGCCRHPPLLGGKLFATTYLGDEHERA